MLNVPAFALLRRGKECFRSSRHPQHGLQPLAFSLQPSQKGVALVITLILLSVVTFMAVTFLILSQRERGAVTTVTETAGARLAADAALANAEAQIVANALATTNPCNFGLLVSTNYINYAGFVSGSSSFTNVNYQYANGNPLSLDDFRQNLTNLWYSPRPPVFISTNAAGGNDFRYYLDLNRNGRFDTNGWVTNVDNTGVGLGTTNFQVGDPEWIGILEKPDQPYGPNNKFIARYAFIAVPAGNTLDLNAIHNEAHAFPRPPQPPPGSPNVEGVNPSQSGYNDNFVRNEGVGSWEINLAAFLTDLNTNEWDPPANSYSYQDSGLYNNLGYAFDDARALLTYRYNNDFRSLTTIRNLFSPAGVTVFTSDNIDGYTYGQPLMTSFRLPGDQDSNLRNIPWVGANNTNHFFSQQDLFNTSDTAMGVSLPQMALNNYFTYRLLQAGTNTFGKTVVPTYDRYTFYRLLSQLGTDTAPEQGKMNINYDNLNPYVFNGNGILVLSTNGVAASTNFAAWQPLAFFTNAADRLLRAYTTQWRNGNPTNFATTFYAVNNFNFDAANFASYPAFGVGHIPVLVSNQFVYTPAVNRLLQLAANMCDATTNNFGVNGNKYDYPSVFRPLFSRDADAFGVAGLGTNVFITGYTNVLWVTGASDPLFAPPIDASDLATTNIVVTNMAVNVYGVPWIIGAKKGFPNFNELAMDCAFQLTRKLQVARTSPSASSDTYSNYQMFILNITNQIGVECWNSYTNSYTNGVMIYAADYLKNIVLRNDEGFGTNLSFYIPNALPVGNWLGYNPNQPSFSFQIPLNYSLLVITNSIYRFNQGSTPYLTSDLYETYETNVVGYPQPHWWLMVTNDLRVIMLDTNTPLYRIIDYVQLSGPNGVRDLTSEIISEYDNGTGGHNLWDTNFQNGIPRGLSDQVNVSMGTYTPDPASGTWDQTDVTRLHNEIDGFRAFYGIDPLYNNVGAGQAIAAAKMTNNMQAPYTPTATVVQHISWQANDPLVHYLASDLNWSGANKFDRTVESLTSTNENLGALNYRYSPWGVGVPLAGTADQNLMNLAYKDPLVRMSDDWDFPTNKFPTVGWLGRVHRGTPWQTVYLKATNILDWAQSSPTPANGLVTWVNWTGNGNLFDAINAAPVQDRLLFDLFTTAFNDNATRGTLSVNVGAPNGPSLAAWSALFSGLMVLSNNAVDSDINPTLYVQHAGTLTNYTAFPINPAGPYYNAVPPPPLVQLVNGINQTRANTNVFPLQTFTRVGDILRVPQLTEQSPFLHWNNLAQQQNGISDEMYEWLPQQTMSLLRCSSSPRYVIYCYGQTLKPAANGIYNGGGAYFGMVTNYQIVSEIATRAVVRFGSIRTNVVTYVTDYSTYTNWFTVPVVTNNNAVIENFNILPPD